MQSRISEAEVDTFFHFGTEVGIGLFGLRFFTEGNEENEGCSIFSFSYLTPKNRRSLAKPQREVPSLTSLPYVQKFHGPTVSI